MKSYKRFLLAQSKVHLFIEPWDTDWWAYRSHWLC